MVFYSENGGGTINFKLPWISIIVLMMNYFLWIWVLKKGYPRWRWINLFFKCETTTSVSWKRPFNKWYLLWNKSFFRNGRFLVDDSRRVDSVCQWLYWGRYCFYSSISFTYDTTVSFFFQKFSCVFQYINYTHFYLSYLFRYHFSDT